ncbi:MAG: hypothetical protein ACM3N4_11675 [Nitrososphaerota archaeon]
MTSGGMGDTGTDETGQEMPSPPRAALPAIDGQSAAWNGMDTRIGSVRQTFAAARVRLPLSQ